MVFEDMTTKIPQISGHVHLPTMKILLLFERSEFLIATATDVSLLIMRPFFAFRQKSLFLAGRTSVGAKKDTVAVAKMRDS